MEGTRRTAHPYTVCHAAARGHDEALDKIAAALSVRPASVPTGLIKLRQLMEEKPCLKSKIQSLNN